VYVLSFASFADGVLQPTSPWSDGRIGPVRPAAPPWFVPYGVAVGVGQCSTALSNPTWIFRPLGNFDVRAASSLMTRPPFGTFGVGHVCRTTCRPNSPFVGTFASAHAPSFQSRVVGVPHCVSPLRDDPDPLAAVRGTEIVSTHHARPAGVACRFQVAKHDICAASTQRRHVLCDDPSWSQCPDEPRVFSPQSASFPCFNPRPLPRTGDVLTGKPANDGVNASPPLLRQVIADQSNVTPPPHGRPMPLQDAPAVGIDLDLAHARPAGTLKPQIEAADPGKQGEEFHAAPRRIIRTSARTAESSAFCALSHFSIERR
jgi:hypothetical protein